MAEKIKRKGQVDKMEIQVDKMEVLLSVYRYNDKPVSVIGIKSEKTQVRHDIPKASIPADGWFGVASYIKTMPRILDEVRSGLINNILSGGHEVQFPVLQAAELPDYADLKHTLERKFIEL